MTQFYRLTQRLASPGAGRVLRALLARWLARNPPPGKCLDVGCGPESWLRRADLQPIGVDVSPDFVAEFRRRGGHAVVGCATALPFADGAFDSVWSCGLLHHLPDDAARRAVAEMQRVTRAGGCTVVFDAVLPRAVWRRPVAALLRRMDRGRWMRTEAALTALLAADGAWKCERLTYSLTGLEGLLATFRKPCQ